MNETQVTYIRRDKNGNAKITTVGWKATRKVFVIKGPVTFVSVTYRRQNKPRSKPKRQKDGPQGIRGLLRRCLPSL